MPTRRHIVQAGVALAVSSGVVSMASSSLNAAERPLSADRERLALFRIVFDQRFEASRRFGEHAQAFGASIAAIDGTVHELWEQQLYPRWRESSIAIAGMTTHQALFCLDMMARDAGMQTVYRMHHRDSGAVTSHEMFGPRELLSDDRPLSSNTDDWSRQSARRLTSWPKRWTRLSHEYSNIASAQRRALDSQTLISWLIAPVRKQRVYA